MASIEWKMIGASGVLLLCQLANAEGFGTPQVEVFYPIQLISLAPADRAAGTTYSAVGYGVGASIPVSSEFSLLGSYEMNLGVKTKSVLFAGLEGGIKYYFLGGYPGKVEHPLATAVESPFLGFFGTLAVTQRSYDFTNYLSAQQATTLRVDRMGSFLGLVLGVDAEHFFSPKYYVGSGIHYTRSLAGMNNMSVTFYTFRMNVGIRL